MKENYFVCSCHGKPDGRSDFVSIPDIVVDEDGSERKRKKQRVIVTKTRCNAMMRVKLNDFGMYEVIGHVLMHNYELTRTEWQHCHRSEMAIGDGKEKEITVMTEASTRPAVQYRYECHQYGGAEALGHTSRYHYNFSLLSLSQYLSLHSLFTFTSFVVSLPLSTSPSTHFRSIANHFFSPSFPLSQFLFVLTLSLSCDLIVTRDFVRCILRLSSLTTTPAIRIVFADDSPTP
ncbi:hypothetical protein BVRB_1g023100 [Beta vulgaris subsp. vulgaris]|uniref:FAR1 domain-containing protein n=1 Tax=Beta vulgaris subsp. vulgaris TaxID=3555 RepID=A0A0J8BF39_BETVV|nr:hypothetical protein BVRB_1g023100 [Beta vulgaris subsp. vulgaris]